MSEDLIEKFTRVMGAKTGEVLEVVPVNDGHLVRTHDETWTLVRDDGTKVLAEAPEVTHERDAGVAEPDAEAKPVAKPEPKGRSRS